LVIELFSIETPLLEENVNSGAVRVGYALFLKLEISFITPYLKVLLYGVA
jgi:hypothetical protein